MKVPTTADGWLTVEAPIVKLCPFRSEEDTGTVRVKVPLRGFTPELYSLRAYFDSFETTEISHEDLTQEVCDTLTNQLGGAVVTTFWTTAGMTVECRVISSQPL